MTDVTEFSYPREVLVRVLDRMDAASDSSYERWVLAIAKIIAEAESGPTVYAACTSGTTDQQSQWEVFADGGRGFAIGFDRRILYECARQQGYSLFPMIYDPTRQDLHYEEALLDAVAVIPAEEESLGRGSQLALELALAFCYPLTFVKNPRHASECEWRLMRQQLPGDEKMKPKVRNGDIRYEEIALRDAVSGDCPITHVLAGPRATPQSIAEAETLLRACALSGVPVTRSSLLDFP